MYGFRRASRSGSKSATRALDVLALFGKEQSRLRAKQVGMALGLQPSSTDLLLKTMVYSDYLIFDPITKEYEPSPKLMHFSSFATKIYWDSEKVSAILRELRDRSGALASITLRNGDFMRVVHAEQPEGTHVGASIERAYPLDGISGRTLLSAYEDDEIARILDHAERHRNLGKDWSSTLLPAIRDTAARGFSFGETCSPKVWSAAALVTLGPRSANRVAVLAASGHKTYIQARGQAIIEVTRRLAEELGALQ